VQKVSRGQEAKQIPRTKLTKRQKSKNKETGTAGEGGGERERTTIFSFLERNKEYFTEDSWTSSIITITGEHAKKCKFKHHPAPAQQYIHTIAESLGDV
jgi:hypothetical protein